MFHGIFTVFLFVFKYLITVVTGGGKTTLSKHKVHKRRLNQRLSYTTLYMHAPYIF